MIATIRLGARATHTAPETLLGQNLEMAGDTAAGLLSDRLTNAKFLGPATPQTGIAPGWQPAFSNNSAGMTFALVEGMGLNGGWAQMLHNTSGRTNLGILQIDRWVRAGERLQVTLWARAQGHPVTIKVGIRPLAGAAPAYDAATLPITTTYPQEYRATLCAPRDDAQAVFFLTVEEQGMVWLDQVRLEPVDQPLLRADLVAALRRLDIPVLRFPGGCISTNYHWRFGAGPRHLRPLLPDPVFKWDTNYEFGTDEYLALCQEQGIRPQISVNMGTGTPAEAAEWAAYVWAWYQERSIEPPAAYWQMGNEQWGAWEVGNLSGEMYADALRAYVPGVRAAYPKARVIALGPETGETIEPEARTPWRAPVLDRAGELVDLLAIQRYARVWEEDPARQMVAALRGVQEMGRAITGITEDCAARGVAARAAVTEWNLWRQASHHDQRGFLEPYDVQHGLFVAAALHDFARRAPGLELANFYHLVNPMGLFISRGPDVEATTTVDLFHLYRPAFPGGFVPVEVGSPELAEGLPCLDALALHNAGGRWLFVANRSVGEDAQVDITSLADTAGEMLVGEAPNGRFHTEPVDVHNSALALPPLSVARLHVPA